MESLKTQLCLRCESKGIEKKADTYIKTDGLLNDDFQPICHKCKKEWKREFAALELGEEWEFI